MEKWKSYQFYINKQTVDILLKKVVKKTAPVNLHVRLLINYRFTLDYSWTLSKTHHVVLDWSLNIKVAIDPSSRQHIIKVI